MAGANFRGTDSMVQFQERTGEQERDLCSLDGVPCASVCHLSG